MFRLWLFLFLIILPYSCFGQKNWKETYQFKHKFWTHLNVGLGLKNGNINYQPTNTIIVHFDKNVNEFVKQKTSPIYQFGLSYELLIKNVFSVQLGIQISKRDYIINSSIPFCSECLIKDSAGVVPVILYERDTLYWNHLLQQKENNLNIEVPFLIGLNFRGFSISGGVKWRIYQSRDVYFKFNRFVNFPIQFHNYSKHLFFFWNFNIGYEFRLSKKLAIKPNIGIEGYEYNEFTVRYKRIDLMFGVAFSFWNF